MQYFGISTLTLILAVLLVVQWIGCVPPKDAMQVRFLPRGPFFFFYTTNAMLINYAFPTRTTPPRQPERG